ncbi:MAG: hypothetical protein AMJ46_12020 [Latescibacteria bacterium DG_63]|nr:MAG: hypothetical protein AMJ46_12020 [Latescibacteria bacterium DG_63]
MIFRNPLCNRPLLLALSLAVIMLAGCAAKKVLLEAPETGVTLEYRMPKDQTLKYEMSQEFIQNVEIQGRQMEVNAYTTYAFSVESKGEKDGNLQFAITIDAMEVNVTSPEGDISGDTKSAVGKSFEMLLSPLGEELETPGLGGIKYELGPAGKRSIASNFETLFPNLAGRPLKVGDSWTSRDTVSVREANTNLQFTFESINTVEGFETVAGLECAKIASDVTGTLAGTGKEGQMELVTSGEVQGKDTWYFAYKEGLYVKAESEAFVKGSITTADPQGMKIPMNNTIRIELALVDDHNLPGSF